MNVSCESLLKPYVDMLTELVVSAQAELKDDLTDPQAYINREKAKG